MVLRVSRFSLIIVYLLVNAVTGMQRLSFYQVDCLSVAVERNQDMDPSNWLLYYFCDGDKLMTFDELVDENSTQVDAFAQFQAARAEQLNFMEGIDDYVESMCLALSLNLGLVAWILYVDVARINFNGRFLKLFGGSGRSS